MKWPSIDEFETIVTFAQTRGFEENDARKLLFSYLQNPTGGYVKSFARVVELYYES